jgi:hypothetical protein
MNTASEQAPAARGSLGRGADRKHQARELFRAGHSQREIAAKLGVTQTSVWRYCQGIERTAPPPDELSPREAVARAVERGFTGLTKESVLLAIEGGRLVARWGERSASYGRTGPRAHWIISATDFEQFLESLEPCLHPECNQAGVTAEGFCSRAHAMSVTIKALDPEKARQRALEWWRTGESQARVLIEKTGGPARRRWKGRWGGSKPPAPGARPRGGQRLELSEEEKARVRLACKHGWRRRKIATHLGLSEWLVRRYLEELDPALNGSSPGS